MIINHNLNAMNAHRNMGMNTVNSGKSMEKLSSGLRINRAGDDAAGLGISEKMRGQIRGLDQASRNAQDGISMIQTAEGALNETHSILQRMRELANQSANGTNTDTDRGSIQDEMNQLTSEINRIGNTTEFNTQKLLNGGVGSNNGGNLTKATGASIVSSVAFSAAAAAVTSASITVDNLTFKLDSIKLTAASTTTIVDSLKNLTSGSTKLGDLIDVKIATTGELTLTAKSTGSNSSIKINSTASTALKLDKTKGISVGGTVKGLDTTIDKVGVQGGKSLTAAATTINKNDSIKITIGSDSAAEVVLNTDATKTYDTKNADANVAKAAMNQLVSDLNNALKTSGMSDKVEVSLSKDNTLQFISKEGKDIKIANGTGKAVSTALTFTATSSAYKGTTIKQIVGPGVQGSGYNTTFQIGANKGQSMALNINDMRSAALGITGNAGQAGFTKANGVTDGTTDIKQEAALNVMTKEDASKAIDTLDKATATVSAERGKLGAMQNRLEHTINNLGTSSENLSAAESRIRDVDMAKEMLNFSKNNILSQASQAMLAQAKSQPEAVLQLLR